VSPLRVCVSLLALLVYVWTGSSHARAPVGAMALMGTTGDARVLSRPARWSPRGSRPLRVWIEPGPTNFGWRARHEAVLWEALEQWTSDGEPVRFVRAVSANRADVIGDWVGRLPGRSLGRTRRQEVGGTSLSARVTLALLARRGRPIAEDVQLGAALHEVGHLLGLKHERDRRSIMYPEVWASAVSPHDLAVLRRLYTSFAG